MQDRSPADLLARLHADFGDAGWQAARVLAAFEDADDLCSESVGQVFAPSWSRGRVGLLGDAAWCAAPVSGMGTSLSLVGAYVPAGELAGHDDPAAGFAAYERVMRPYVDQAQELPPGTPRLADPRTRAGIAAFHGALRVAAALPSWVGGEGLRPVRRAARPSDVRELTAQPRGPASGSVSNTPARRATTTAAAALQACGRQAAG
ncbi:MAG: hypothetical protein ACRYG2_06200 [Janthinobacterium lividum]